MASTRPKRPRARTAPNPKIVGSASSATALTLDDERFAVLVSPARLRATWKLVRREARQHRVRDVIDFLDWARSIDETLSELSRSLLVGDYAPAPPARYELAKAKGSFRIITVPALRDALVYRLICDEALAIALPQKVQGAFFSRRYSRTPIGKTFNLADDPYLHFLDIWKRYHQYRTKTLLNAPYDVLVVADISNFFESISHEMLMEYLSPLGLPRKGVGLLGRLLEALKPPTGHSPNPRIGIPVDEFECSRELAHVLLFEHDRRIVRTVGEENYVRWMDDQNVGVPSLAEARRTVNLLTRSLSLQRLTLNTGKTRFLHPNEVIDYFHLDANEAIDAFDRAHLKTAQIDYPRARRSFQHLWTSISGAPSARHGHWDKVLKRLYGVAAKIASKVLDTEMQMDLVDYPDLDERIFVALARRNRPLQLLALFKTYCRDWGSLYEATEASVFDAALLTDMTPKAEKKWLKFALSFINGLVDGQCAGAYGKAAALQCLYWFGCPGIQLGRIFLRSRPQHLPAPVARTWLAITTTRSPRLLPQLQAALVGHPSDDVARLSQFLSALVAGNVHSFGEFNAGKRPRWPAPGHYYDARSWLQLELMAIGGSVRLRSEARRTVAAFAPFAQTRQERRILQRIRTALARLR
jgi:hypothetical protein